jgi:hypothetical protein
MVDDNESAVNSSNIPAGKLHKRHIALSWYRVRELIPSKILYFIHIPGAINPSDMLSKQWGYQKLVRSYRHCCFGRVTPPIC